MADLFETVFSFRSNLSEDEVREYAGFTNQVMIDDYLGIGEVNGVFADAISTNIADIAALDSRVTQNEADIFALQTDLAALIVDFNNHVTDTSAHGVTGDNVGTEDFCTDLIGGVVLLMALVNDAVASTAEVTLADVGVAPVTYDQTYAQAQTDLINDVKAKHNTLLTDVNNAITQLNDMIDKAKTAKQMSTV